MKASTLRPGLLVSMKTSIQGNVSYVKNTIEEDHLTADGAREAEWATRRIIADPAEHEVATKVRNGAADMIRSTCVRSAFGLLCPEGKAEDLDKLIAGAHAMTAKFNDTAKISRVHVYVLVGRIAPNDVEAVKAINSEVRELLSSMEDGIKNLDVRVIRDAAAKAKGLGSMLSKDAQERVQDAVNAARAVATKINKAGEQAAQEVDRVTIAKITEARVAFLDIDGEAIEVQNPSVQARAVDFDAVVVAQTGPHSETRTIDME